MLLRNSTPPRWNTVLAASVLTLSTIGFVADVRAADKQRPSDTETPIKHVIVVIGENRSFDHVFGTYVPRHGQSIDNLAIGAAYCNICNFESYATSIMGDAAQREAHIKDAVDFFAAVQQGTLPAVAFVKPDGLLDGHPATSKVDLFERMLQKILDTLQNPKLAANTAVLVTVDEGGGYFDSGYIQPIDFFGDGPRIPLIVVSPFSRGGKVVHSYTDHVSILKFIERNWRLKPLTARSRDNLPNPVTHGDNAYVPVNAPAIGDLFDMFDFGHDGDDNGGGDNQGDDNDHGHS